VANDSRPVLVVDDDSGFRSLVSSLLAHVGYPTVEAESGEEALAAARQERPAAVLLDVCLPRISGYEVCQQLRDQLGEALPILFVSGERTDPLDRTAGLLIGADEYLVKPLDVDEFLARMHRLVGRAPSWNPKEMFGLTNREQDVLRLLAEGLSQKEIARELVISAKTVAAHIQNVLGKLGVHSRTQAVAIAHREGILRQPG
jgi:two-component system, NarL family, nitrate/nitrite response regulator NarL